MLSGEVVIQSMWSPAVTAVRSQGVPCIYSDLDEGYRSWGIGFLLSKYVEGKKLGAVYDFFDWYYSGPAGAFFARQGYYMPTPEQTRQHLPADEWDFWFEGKPAVNEVKDPFGNVMGEGGQRAATAVPGRTAWAGLPSGTRRWPRTPTSSSAGTSS